MALPVLDGNQTATTLSSVVTGGEHIVAHSVVSLGANAIANITSAVSGSVVSISNFPASQSTTFGAVTGSVSVLNFPSTQTIAGTVTANGGDFSYIEGDEPPQGKGILIGYIRPENQFQPAAHNHPLPISGTVTANLVAFDVANEDRRPLQIADTGVGLIVAGSTNPNDYPVIVSGTVTVGNSVTIGSLPAISGTVTAAAPNGSLTTRFGTPTTANVSFATSAVTNANRKYLLIQNVTTGSNVITVGIGFTPTTTQGIQLTAGAGITFESSYIPTGQIFVLSSVTASNFTILEA